MSHILPHQNAWIFDVDGVLTNLLEKKVTEPTLLLAMAKILEKGDLIACNTGRDVAFVEKNVFTPLHDVLSDTSLLSDVFISGEKGAVWQQLGHTLNIDHTLSVPLSLREKVRHLVEQEFADAMFFDPSKKTMISLEINHGVSLEYFAARKQALLPLLESYLQQDHLEQTFKIDPSVSAVDVQHQTSGKDMGMQHILTWIQTQNHQPKHFYCFGDSGVDIHMGELLQDQALPFTFVYVGEKPLDKTPSFPLVIPSEKLEKGTVAFLASHVTTN